MCKVDNKLEDLIINILLWKFQIIKPITAYYLAHINSLVSHMWRIHFHTFVALPIGCSILRMKPYILRYICYIINNQDGFSLHKKRYVVILVWLRIHQNCKFANDIEVVKRSQKIKTKRTCSAQHSTYQVTIESTLEHRPNNLSEFWKH